MNLRTGARGRRLFNPSALRGGGPREGRGSGERLVGVSHVCVNTAREGAPPPRLLNHQANTLGAGLRNSPVFEGVLPSQAPVPHPLRPRERITRCQGLAPARCRSGRWSELLLGSEVTSYFLTGGVTWKSRLVSDRPTCTDPTAGLLSLPRDVTCSTPQVAQRPQL